MGIDLYDCLNCGNSNFTPLFYAKVNLSNMVYDCDSIAICPKCESRNLKQNGIKKMGLTEQELEEMEEQRQEAMEKFDKMKDDAKIAYDKLVEYINGCEEKMNESVEEKESYPVGYDPKGEWTVTINNGEWVACSIYEYINFLEAVESDCLDAGHRFTTKEQAQNKADGLNNLKELIFAIHEENKTINVEVRKWGFYVNDENELQWDIQTTPCNLQICSYQSGQNIYDKLGEEKIKSALIWGLG